MPLAEVVQNHNLFSIPDQFFNYNTPYVASATSYQNSYRPVSTELPTLLKQADLKLDYLIRILQSINVAFSYVYAKLVCARFDTLSGYSGNEARIIQI